MITTSEREQLERLLAEVERVSGRGIRKWHNSRYKERECFVREIAKTSELKGKIYARIYTNGQNYLKRTAEVIADSLHQFGVNTNSTDYRSVIIVDGLKDGEVAAMGRTVRQKGIRVEKIRGIRDESSILVRLADSMAGLLRDAHEGDARLGRVVDRLKKKGMVSEV